MKKSVLLLGMATMCMAAAMFCGCGQKKELAPSVVKNLQTAYNGESNASAKYAMYAEKANAAGYKSVAALFKAASKAESIHAARQAKVLRSYGIEPKADVKLPKYVDVAASLQDGIKGETYEMVTMYPDFIKDAKAQNAPQKVMEAFQFALEAEKEHAKMYTAAAADLKNWKAPGKTFYVCTVCGYTTNNSVNTAVCILCASPKEKFEVFK